MTGEQATVTVYSKPACVQCDATYRALEKKGIEYSVVDISADVDAVLDRHDLTIPEGRVAGLRAAAAHVARVPLAPLLRSGFHLRDRLAPHTDLTVIQHELAIAHATHEPRVLPGPAARS